jgi:hypothetical protein
MMKFYPAESGNDDERRIVRGPPRPLPHFYVGNVTLDPNKTAAELKERKNDKRRPPDGVKTPRSRRENSQPKDHVAKRPNDDKM